jgi:DNA modification methylase
MGAIMRVHTTKARGRRGWRKVLTSQALDSSTTPQRMRLVEPEEYGRFLRSHEAVHIENVDVKLVKDWKISQFQPDNFAPEEWTVWSFPDRGDWATHKGNYRGNWSPFIPRNLIEKYTRPGELVCDPMVGSGTTLVECKLLDRRGLGVDVNPDAGMVAMNRLDFRNNENPNDSEIRVFVGDARHLDRIEDESVDLIATHPPYAGILSYSNSKVAGDLSSLSLSDFIREIGLVASECFRILRPQRYCAILIGDTRKHRHYIPISVGVLSKFLDAGFVLKEDIIKLQHKTKGGRERWSGHKYDFYKIGHEHLYIFRKPDTSEKLNDYKLSMKWW